MIFGRFFKSKKKEQDQAPPADETRQPVEGDSIDDVMFSQPPVGAEASSRSVKKSKKTLENTALSGKRKVKRTVHTKKSFHPKSGRPVTEQVRVLDAIIRPMVTEKSARMSENGTYAFLVRKWATKHTVTDAVEAVYGVRPVRVRMAKKPAKRKRVPGRGPERREYAYTGAGKKAYVFLKQGDTIQLTQ